MEEQKISFETAKLAKEIGIDLPHTHYYVYPFRSFKPDGILKRNATNDDYNHNLLQVVNSRKMQPHMAPAYAQSLLQKWLREEHEIIVFVAPVIPHLEEYGSTIFSNKYNVEIDNCWGKTYEECLELCLFEALKLIKLEENETTKQ